MRERRRERSLNEITPGGHEPNKGGLSTASLPVRVPSARVNSGSVEELSRKGRMPEAPGEVRAEAGHYDE